MCPSGFCCLFVLSCVLIEHLAESPPPLYASGVGAESGKWVWVRDEVEGWMSARVLDGNPESTVSVQLSNGEPSTRVVF